MHLANNKTSEAVLIELWGRQLVAPSLPFLFVAAYVLFIQLPSCQLSSSHFLTCILVFYSIARRSARQLFFSPIFILYLSIASTSECAIVAYVSIRQDQLTCGHEQSESGKDWTETHTQPSPEQLAAGKDRSSWNCYTSGNRSIAHHVSAEPRSTHY